jgi:hypothetical protein
MSEEISGLVETAYFKSKNRVTNLIQQFEEARIRLEEARVAYSAMQDLMDQYAKIVEAKKVITPCKDNSSSGLFEAVAQAQKEGKGMIIYDGWRYAVNSIEWPGQFTPVESVEGENNV